MPFEARYSIDLGKRRWALCTGDPCNKAESIRKVTPELLTLEDDADFLTTYVVTTRELSTLIHGPSGPAPLRRLKCTLGDFTVPPAGKSE